MSVTITKRSALALASGALMSALGSPSVAGADEMVADSEVITGVDGNEISFLVGGSGERTILFIPGFMSVASDWRNQLLYFSRQNRVVAIDPRGQGRSSPVPGKMGPQDRISDYLDVLSHIRSSPPIIVGWSMGCAEALSLYAAFDGGVPALILVDGFLGSDDPAVLTRTHGWMDWMASDQAAFARANKNLMFSPAARDTPMAAEAERQALAISPAVARDIIVPHTALNRAPIISMVDVPTLYIGDSDSARFVPEAFAAAQRPLEEIYVEDVGHAIMLEKPAAFNEALAGFLSRHGLQPTREAPETRNSEDVLTRHQVDQAGVSASVASSA